MAENVMGKPVKVLRSNKNGVSFDKAFQLAKAEGLILVSNKRANQLLNGQELEWKSVKEAWPIHTGTVTAFTKSGQKLGATVEYEDPESRLTWVFEVPAGTGLRSLKDALLAVEHPNYGLEVDDKKKRVVVTPQKKLIIPVENFPSSDGWYATDPTTAIPINQLLNSSDPNARKLWRIRGRVGPVVRGGDFSGVSGRYISVGGYEPSCSFGVLTLEDVSQQIKAETGQ